MSSNEDKMMPSRARLACPSRNHKREDWSVKISERGVEFQGVVGS